MKELKKKLKVMIELTKTGYSAYLEDYSVYTTGNTVSELLNNILEATQFYFEDSYKVTHSNFIYEIDLEQFFKHYRVLNAKFLANRIGMNPTLLSQYVQGHKKPSQKQTKKILDGIQQIGHELSEMKFIYN